MRCPRRKRRPRPVLRTLLRCRHALRHLRRRNHFSVPLGHSVSYLAAGASRRVCPDFHVCLPRYSARWIHLVVQKGRPRLGLSVAAWRRSYGLSFTDQTFLGLHSRPSAKRKRRTQNFSSVCVPAHLCSRSCVPAHVFPLIDCPNLLC